MARSKDIFAGNESRSRSLVIVNGPLALGHVDDTALRKDQRGRVGGLNIVDLNRALTNPVIPGSDRFSLLQANLGGYLVSGVRIIGDNHFVGIMEKEDHRAPRDWEEFLHELDTHRKIRTGVIRRSGGAMRRVATRGELDDVLAQDDVIALATTVEELPVSLDGVSLSQAVKDLKKRRVVQIGPWNNETIGAPHKLSGTSEDYGMTREGAGFIEGVLEEGIAVDLSHSSLNFQRIALQLADKTGGTVLISHTGSPDVSMTRNVSREVIQEVIDRGSVVGLAYQSRMLGGSGLEDITRAQGIILEMDPSGESLIHGFDANGQGLGTQNNDVPTVLEMGKIGEALLDAGVSPEIVYNVDFGNYNRYQHSALPEAA